MATHSSTLAWKMPWMEEPGRLQSMGWQRVVELSNFISDTNLECHLIIQLNFTLICPNEVEITSQWRLRDLGLIFSKHPAPLS